MCVAKATKTSFRKYFIYRRQSVRRTHKVIAVTATSCHFPSINEWMSLPWRHQHRATWCLCYAINLTLASDPYKYGRKIWSAIGRKKMWANDRMNASKKDIIAQLTNQKDKAIKPFFITRFARRFFSFVCVRFFRPRSCIERRTNVAILIEWEFWRLWISLRISREFHVLR